VSGEECFDISMGMGGRTEEPGRTDFG